MNLQPIIARAQREILRDVRAGIVPAGVRSFAALHDHVDANCYGGFCDREYPLAVVQAVQQALDQWIRSKGLTMRTTKTSRRRNSPLRRPARATTQRHAARPRANAAKVPAWYRGAKLGDVARRSTRDIVKWLAWNDREDGDYDDITTRHDALYALVVHFVFAEEERYQTTAETEASVRTLLKVFPEPRR